MLCAERNKTQTKIDTYSLKLEKCRRIDIMGKKSGTLETDKKDDQKKSQMSATDVPPPPAVVRIPMQASNPQDIERYEDLRTTALKDGFDSSVRTIMFTATAHGTGASTTALNFATALAISSSKYKVIMIDVNLRTPGLHEAFKFDCGIGISNFLAADDVSPNIKKVGPGELYVLGCGSGYSMPASLFESKRFEKLLLTLRRQFDYIILDAPPVLFFPESRIISTKADGVVLVLESGQTRRHVALKAKKQLLQSGSKILGIVLNKRKYYIPTWLYRFV